MQASWRRPGLGLGLLAFVVSVGNVAAEPPAARVDIRPDSVAVRPLADCAGLSVSLSDPAGTVSAKRFARGEAAVLTFGANEKPADGVYTYEVALIPPCDRSLGAGHEREGEGLSSSGLVQSGYFRLAGGAVVAATGEPRAAEAAAREAPAPEPDDVVVNDDLIVKGRTCAGTGCANGEAFLVEALRLKQAVPGIKFEDTRALGVGGRDWQIFVNDFLSTASLFSIADLDAGSLPFTIRGDAPSNSLYVDQLGRVGVGTATPAAELHVLRPGPPAIRIEQTGLAPALPRAWNLGIFNSGGFNVRDVATWATPFAIDPGGPSNALVVQSSGTVGIGTRFGSASLHVYRDDGSAKLTVQEANGSPVVRELLELRNTGPLRMRFTNAAAGYSWIAGINGVGLGQSFFISHQAGPAQTLVLEPDGDLTILGALTTNSDRDSKDGIEAVDAQALLAKLKTLPVSTWHRKTDEEQVRHLGPMAQDFAAAFGLGADERRIAPLDVAGVALAAIQALEAQVQALQKQNAEAIQALDAEVKALARQNAELLGRR